MFIALALPPGVYRQGTDLQSSGRYRDANLVRWTEGTMRNMSGWRERTDYSNPMDPAITGAARAILPWRDNLGVVRAAIGSNEGLFVISTTGAVTDITPTGFTPGSADAIFGGGYGAGPYGDESYGTPRLNSAITQPASIWTLDTFGERLIGVMQDDGTIYEWDLSTSPADDVTNAPTARAVLVTDQRIVFALGAGANPRLVQWSNQDDNTDWTPTPLNFAGDFQLQTNGQILCGARVRGGALIWTDTDVHLARFVGQPFVYGFERVASFGIVSANAKVVIDDRAFWMGPRGFFLFDGAAREIPCEVSDFVFSNINEGQISKTTAMALTQFSEVWWFYPSADSAECDRYVVYNYKENHWNTGKINRLCGCDAGEFLFPLMVDKNGSVYDHETGFLYDGLPVFAETGPIQLGAGDNVMFAVRYAPDERTSGNVTATFTTVDFQGSPQQVFGPFQAGTPRAVRFTGRQVRVRYDGVGNGSWRVGVPRLDVMQGGRR